MSILFGSIAAYVSNGQHRTLSIMGGATNIFDSKMMNERTVGDLLKYKGSLITGNSAEEVKFMILRKVNNVPLGSATYTQRTALDHYNSMFVNGIPVPEGVGSEVLSQGGFKIIK